MIGRKTEFINVNVRQGEVNVSIVIHIFFFQKAGIWCSLPEAARMLILSSGVLKSIGKSVRYMKLKYDRILPKEQKIAKKTIISENIKNNQK